MKKIKIEIPYGKSAKWVNGVLTLIDNKSKDITVRIKNFHDAYCELGYEHPFVKSYEKYVNIARGEEADVIAYLKLRIINAALNEGWKPTFEESERRYYSSFYLCTQSEYTKLSENDKRYCVPVRSSINAYAYASTVFAVAGGAGSYSSSFFDVRLSLRTKELAEYCGKQFIDIWADFLFGNKK